MDTVLATRLLVLVTSSALACAAPGAAGRAQEGNSHVVLPPRDGSWASLQQAVEVARALSESARASSPPGADMPGPVVEAWDEVVLRLELALAGGRSGQPPGLRAALAGELLACARHFGDVPPAARLTQQYQSLGTPPPPPASLPDVAAGLRLRWPLAWVLVTSGFGEREDPLADSAQASQHHGVDLAATAGDPVLSAEAGVVVASGWNGGYGVAVDVAHGPAVLTRYAHLTHASVAVGDAVTRGQVLGRAGRTGRATGVHVHFEVRVRGTPVDPAAHLPPPPAVLALEVR